MIPLWGKLPLLICLIMLCSASQSPAEGISPISKLKRIKQAISQQHKKVEENTTKAFNIERELQELDKKLALEQKELQAVQLKLNHQQEELQIQEQKARKIIKEKNKLEVHIKKRLSAFYRMGELTVINTLFAAKSLPDFLNLQEYFQAMFHYDQNNLKKYKANLFLISQAKKSIQANKEKLVNFIAQGKNKEQQLIATRLARNNLLEQIKIQKKLYQQSLVAMRESAAHLRKIIDKMTIPVITGKPKKIYINRPAKKKQAAQISGFAAQKGQLPYPISSPISRYFGTQAGSFGITIQSTGLDFAIEKTTKVRAIYPGVIIYADKMAGYGKIIIIDHGQQYYSLYAGLTKFLKVKGDTVKAGDFIGYTPINGTMHFEIRHKSKPLDPALWLNKSHSKNKQSSPK